METGGLALSGVTVGSGDGVPQGASHVCALDALGGIHCWGNNASGQLGNDDTSNSNEPVAVHMPVGVKATSVTAGVYYTCAVASNGVYCWGNNQYGQLGDGTMTDRWTPVLVAGTRGKAGP